MNTTQKKMGLSLMIASFFFLFNPEFAAVDPIPDLCGYVIIYFALTRLSDIDVHMEEARRKFKHAIYVGIAELVALAILFGLVIESERSITLLIMTFIFGIADIVILIPAFKELFDGFTNLGMLCDGSAMFKNKNGRENRTEITLLITKIFVISKAALACLPEFTSLINNSEYRFVGILRVFAVIISLAIGIIWLIKIISYITAIKKDKRFVDNISEKYTVLRETRPLLFVKRRLIFGIGVICVGLALSIDLYGDYFNFLPDFLSAAVILFGAWSLRKFSPRWKLVSVFSAIYGFISAASWTLSVRFFNEYYPEAALKVTDAYNKFQAMFYADIADAVFFVILVLSCAVLFADIAKIHAAPRDKCTLSKEDLYFEELQKGKIIFILLSVLSSAMTLYYVYFLTSYSNVWYVAMSVMFTFVCDIAFAAYTMWFGNTLKKEISSRYSLA